MNRNTVLLTTLLLFALHAVTLAAEVIIVPSQGARSISQAMVRARSGDTIMVEDGVYKESIFLKADVTVKARNRHKAIIDGGGRGIAVTMSANSTLSGMSVTNATIGVFSNSSSAVLEHCLINQNWMTGVMSVRHLPQMNDNTVVFNKGSGLVIWDARSTNSAVEHNTIAYNVGFGVFLGGRSEVVMRNNTVAYNQKFGLRMSDESKESNIIGNNFFGNLHALYNMPDGNYSFDPQFRSARVDMDFQPDAKCCAIRTSNNENLGVRFSK